MRFKTLSALPLIAALFAMLLQSAASFVWAEEIVISGNGSESTSSVDASVSQTTTITQSNDANIENNVNTSTETGGNTTSDNTGGDVAILTGDASQNLEIDNSLNSSSVDAPCCPSGLSVEVSGNGEGSVNEVGVENNSTSQISISQNANIENNANGSANTGDNQAEDNTGGSVLIDTGNIWVTGGINNGPVNFYSIEGGNGNGDVSVKISGNGSGSTNLVSLLLGDLAKLSVNNFADIENWVSWDLNTGRNEANGNTGGDVDIKTGDIFFNLGIENDPINVGGIIWGCCHPTLPPGGGGDGGDGETPPGGNLSGSSSSSSSSSSSAGAGGYVLALAETSSEGYPVILFGLTLVAIGASLVNKKRFV